MIDATHKVHPAYGHKRLSAELGVNRKRILRVMHKYSIKPPRRRIKRYYTKVRHSQTYTNLIRGLTPTIPNQVWASDLTYIKYKGRFIYLATVTDIFSRRILAARVGGSHNKELTLGVIKIAVAETEELPQIFHSDQGREYMARACTEYLEDLGIKVSVNDKGSPWQNAYQESFFGKFKVEVGDFSRFETAGELVEEIYSYISYYNNFRIHTALKMPPTQFLESFLHKRGT